MCRHVSMWGFQNPVCLSVRLSVCPYPEKRNHHSFVNISPTLVIDTSTGRSSRVLQHGNQKIWFEKFDFWLKSSKLNLTCILTCAEELKSFKWVSTCTYMSTSGMHRRPFEGRHLVVLCSMPSELCPASPHDWPFPLFALASIPFLSPVPKLASLSPPLLGYSFAAIGCSQ